MYSGYGGLDLAVAAASALPVRVLWHCEIDPDASHVLKIHHPDVPNLGADDAQDWSQVARPDILAGGPPCQAISQAGRQGAEADPRWRWPHFLTALRELRPAAFIVENPVGLTTHLKGATWTGILDEMRAAGYAVAWVIIGACAVGAPHCRHRVFAVGRLRAQPGEAVRLSPERHICGKRGPLLPTPLARDGDGRGDSYRGQEWRRMNQGMPLRAVVRLLPTVMVSDTTGVIGERWADFAPAVERWSAMTRPAPEPTEPTGRGGDWRLSPLLPEWMHGLPVGYLTDHVGRNAAIRLAGNGVVPAQATAAIRMLRDVYRG